MRCLLLVQGADVACGDSLAPFYVIRKRIHDLASLPLERRAYVPAAKPSDRVTLEYSVRTGDFVMARNYSPSCSHCYPICPRG